MIALLPSHSSPCSYGALTGPNLLFSNSLSGSCIYEVQSKQWHLSRHLDHTLSSLLSLCLCLSVSVERPIDPCFSGSEESSRVSVECSLKFSQILRSTNPFSVCLTFIMFICLTVYQCLYFSHTWYVSAQKCLQV